MKVYLVVCIYKKGNSAASIGTAELFSITFIRPGSDTDRMMR